MVKFFLWIWSPPPVTPLCRPPRLLTQLWGWDLLFISTGGCEHTQTHHQQVPCRVTQRIMASTWIQTHDILFCSVPFGSVKFCSIRFSSSRCSRQTDQTSQHLPSVWGSSPHTAPCFPLTLLRVFPLSLLRVFLLSLLRVFLSLCSVFSSNFALCSPKVCRVDAVLGGAPAALKWVKLMIWTFSCWVSRWLLD